MAGFSKIARIQDGISSRFTTAAIARISKTIRIKARNTLHFTTAAIARISQNAPHLKPAIRRILEFPAFGEALRRIPQLPAFNDTNRPHFPKPTAFEAGNCPHFETTWILKTRRISRQRHSPAFPKTLRI